MKTLLILIPALPLASVVITAIAGPLVQRRIKSDSTVAAFGIALPTVASFAFSFLFSALLLLQVAGQQSRVVEHSTGFEAVYTLWSWADVEDAYLLTSEATTARTTPANSGWRDFRIDVTLRADSLTAIMLVTVTFVSTLVAVFSIGYMKGDRGYWRFFTYISLFVFSMTMLVSVSNFLLLYVFWEAVGVCSYLLIGFWYQKPEAAAAGKKAFLVNRVGDFGFALAIFLIWTAYGTLNFHDTAERWENGKLIVSTEALSVAATDANNVGGTKVDAGVLGPTLAHRGGYHGGMIGLAICLLLMAGACGKSAQFPLHVWLPDAMEGPTPVSALIHAATMVTAGVYMIARCTPLFMVSPEAQLIVATIGGFTALLAALIALTQYDLKRVLAYSTISQLGYMFLALGTGTLAGITAGMFHLFTHAFFKALLFLGAGSVMHAMGGVIDMRRFGGLRKIMPITHLTFAIGCLALAGFPLLAGFWSKDAILASVHDKMSEHPAYEMLYYIGLFTALLTAFYTFRAFFMTFYGEEQIPDEAGHHAHESPATMWIPLAILAIGSCGLGPAIYLFSSLLEGAPPLLAAVGSHDAGHHEEAHGGHGIVMFTSSLIALFGIGAAAYLYLGSRKELNALAGAMKRLGLYQLSYGKFFFDQIYAVLFIWPLRILATVSFGFDRWIVDGLVNFCGRVPVWVGALMRSLQMGLVPFYALGMAFGVLVLIACWMILAAI